MLALERPLILLAGLPLLPVGVYLWYRACGRVRAALQALGQDRPSYGRRNRWRGIFRLCALATVLLAAAGPVWKGSNGTAPTAAVVFVLDVSASMNCTEVAPNRLAAARRWIGEANRLLPGDAVGLVAAGGGPSVVCPPTADHSVFDMLLDRIDRKWTTDAGTRLAPSLERASELLKRSGASRAAVIVVSDGEDHGPSLGPVLREMERGGFACHSVCVGGTEPAPVPEFRLSDGFSLRRTESGKPVLSAARPEAMRRWARRGDGRFWRVAPRERTAPHSRKELVIGTGLEGLRAAEGTFALSPWLCGLALALLLADVALSVKPVLSA